MTMDDTRGLILVTCHFSSQNVLRLVYIISVMMIRSTRSTISLSSDHSKASEECVCVCVVCVGRSVQTMEFSKSNQPPVLWHNCGEQSPGPRGIAQVSAAPATATTCSRGACSTGVTPVPRGRQAAWEPKTEEQLL